MSIGTMFFLLIVIMIFYVAIQPFLKEIDKRNAENRLAKKIAQEMKKENEERKAD